VKNAIIIIDDNKELLNVFDNVNLSKFVKSIEPYDLICVNLTNELIFETIYDKIIIDNFELINFIRDGRSEYDAILIISNYNDYYFEIDLNCFDSDKINAILDLELFIFTKNKNFTKLMELIYHYGIHSVKENKIVNKIELMVPKLVNFDNYQIGIIFSGISYDEGIHYNNTGKLKKRNFLNTYQNHLDKLINGLHIGCVSKVFLTTYTSKYDEQLLQNYKPDKCLTLDKTGNYLDTYLKSLDNINEEDLKTTDFFISTRFDIMFYNEFKNWNIDYHKFNILFIETWGGNEIHRMEVCDVIFAFPTKFFKNFKQAVYDCYTNPRYDDRSGDLHHIYEKIIKYIGKSSVHFVSSVKQSTAGANFEGQTFNSFFYLCREEINKKFINK
jgi:hypothetical protein